MHNHSNPSYTLHSNQFPFKYKPPSAEALGGNKNIILKYWMKRKEKQKAEQRTWDEKKKKLEDNTRELQEKIKNENIPRIGKLPYGAKWGFIERKALLKERLYWKKGFIERKG